MSLVLTAFSKTFSVPAEGYPKDQILEYMGIPYGPDDVCDLAFVQALARSIVIKMYRYFLRREDKQQFTLFKSTLKDLNDWPTSSMTSTEAAWADIFYRADTFRAKAFKACVMYLMLEDARSNGLAFLEYFCAQHYHLIWNSNEGYAKNHRDLVDSLAKKQD